jgi:hypothetical protein
MTRQRARSDFLHSKRQPSPAATLDVKAQVASGGDSGFNLHISLDHVIFDVKKKNRLLQHWDKLPPKVMNLYAVNRLEVSIPWVQMLYGRYPRCRIVLRILPDNGQDAAVDAEDIYARHLPTFTVMPWITMLAGNETSFGKNEVAAFKRYIDNTATLLKIAGDAEHRYAYLRAPTGNYDESLYVHMKPAFEVNSQYENGQFHSYSPNEYTDKAKDGGIGSIGRYRLTWKMCEDAGLPRPDTHIGEFGLTLDYDPEKGHKSAGSGVPSEESYIKDTLAPLYQGTYQPDGVAASTFMYPPDVPPWNALAIGDAALDAIEDVMSNQPDPPITVTTTFDMAAYILGKPGMITMFSTGEVCETQYSPTDSRHAYFVKNGNSEELVVCDGYIWRGTDTSESESRYYQQYGGSLVNKTLGARWCPQVWQIGKPYKRAPIVQHFDKATGEPVSEPQAVESFLEIVAHHPAKQFPSSLVIEDVLELAWYFDPQQPKTERYWYAKGLGLVGFSNAAGFTSHIVQVGGGQSPIRKTWPGIQPMTLPIQEEPPVETQPLLIQPTQPLGSPKRVRIGGNRNLRYGPDDRTHTIVRTLQAGTEFDLYPDTQTAGNGYPWYFTLDGWVSDAKGATLFGTGSAFAEVADPAPPVPTLPAVESSAWTARRLTVSGPVRNAPFMRSGKHTDLEGNVFDHVPGSVLISLNVGMTLEVHLDILYSADGHEWIGMKVNVAGVVHIGWMAVIGSVGEMFAALEPAPPVDPPPIEEEPAPSPPMRPGLMAAYQAFLQAKNEIEDQRIAVQETLNTAQAQLLDLDRHIQAVTEAFIKVLEVS